MIGRDENQVEVSYQVADRRKFNPDGSLKEGVVIEPTPAPPAETTPAEPAAEAETPNIDDIDMDAITLDDEEDVAADDLDDSDIPGAKDPASFVNFLSSLATNAAAALGAVPHPATGQRSLDLDSGKYWLDILSMLKEKTAGNLHPKEQRLLDGLLADLRMQYVHLMRATEEKLKARGGLDRQLVEFLGRGTIIQSADGLRRDTHHIDIRKINGTA